MSRLDRTEKSERFLDLFVTVEENSDEDEVEGLEKAAEDAILVCLAALGGSNRAEEEGERWRRAIFVVENIEARGRESEGNI